MAVPTKNARFPKTRDGAPVAGGVKRRSAMDREKQLMAAALDLFAERNFASVTIKDIARATGVNTALIYYYFENKDDLFRAVIEDAVNQAFDNFRKLRERTEDPAEIIDDWLKNHVELFEPIHKLVKVSLDYSGARKKVVAIDRSIRQFYEEEARMLSGCIRQGIAEGIFRKVDPEQLALFISTYLDGVMVRSVIMPDLDLERVVDYLRQQVWSILDYDTRSGNRSDDSLPAASIG